MTSSNIKATTGSDLKFRTEFTSDVATVDEAQMNEEFLISSDSREDPTVFAARFSRCYRLLHFIGSRVLGSPEGVEDAINNCWFTASHSSPSFQYEAAFRSWLIRVLIDEALDILRKNRAANVDADEC